MKDTVSTKLPCLYSAYQGSVNEVYRTQQSPGG